MINIITKILIALYWVVLICFNIRNFRHMEKEAKDRNKYIYALILVNASVIIFCILTIFL